MYSFTSKLPTWLLHPALQHPFVSIPDRNALARRRRLVIMMTRAPPVMHSHLPSFLFYSRCKLAKPVATIIKTKFQPLSS